jgi:vacuolar protein sorting-associated protein 13B
LNSNAEAPAPEVKKNTDLRKLNMPDMNIISKQFVLSFKSDTEAEVMLSLATLSITISNILRPESIYVNLTWDAFIVSMILDSKTIVLLNPFSCNIIISIIWESWQSEASSPQIQIQIDSDCIYLDFGPKHVLILKSVLPEFQEVVSKISSMHDSQLYEEEMLSFISHEQHYKDDLKSGAFQFVDGNEEELPFPYQVIIILYFLRTLDKLDLIVSLQVVFFSFPQQAMAWRYPHPRALTKIHVCPVPFEVINLDMHMYHSYV